MNILIIDSDQVYAKLLGQAIKRELKKVIEVNTVFAAAGQEAMDLLDSASIDLIITEYQIGEKSFFDLFNEVKSYSDLFKIPVVLLTTKTELELFGLNHRIKKTYDVVEVFYKQSFKISDLVKVIMDNTNA